MDKAISDGAMQLIEFGILGVFCLLFMVAIVYLNKQNRASSEKLLAVKDQQIKSMQDTIDKHLTTQAVNIREQTMNVTRMIDLYSNLNDKIADIPDRVATKINTLK